MTLRIKRAYGGVYLVGRRRYLTIKWLRPGVRAIKAGIWQRQIGRLLVRLARGLEGRPDCSGG